MFWGRNKPTPEKIAAEKPADAGIIHFSSGDTMHERAEKIWRAIGMVNDRFGATAQIASYLYMYRDWDAERQPLGNCFECREPLVPYCPKCNPPTKPAEPDAVRPDQSQSLAAE